MLCVSCGKLATVGSFCDECYSKDRPLISAGPGELRLCPECGAYYDGEWKPSESEGDAIVSFAESRVKKLGRVKTLKLSYRLVGNKATVSIEARGTVPPSKHVKTDVAKAEIKLRKIKCDECVKLAGNYYEAVIQVRGPRADEIVRQVRGGLAQQTKDGYDVQFVHKGDAIRIAQSLKGRYEVKSSFKLAAEKKGKKLYRNYYAIR